MASWIVHLRVADMLLDSFHGLSPEHFIAGNIAPDSGKPSADGLTFEPPKAVSHWYRERGGETYIGGEEFFDEYAAGERGEKARAFYLGYYSHLFTDARWVEEIYRPKKAEHIGAFGTREEFQRAFKHDLYGQDHIFIEENPGFRAYRVFRSLGDFPNTYVPYFEENAFSARFADIIKFYEEPLTELHREYEYVTAAELDAFVLGTAEILKECLRNFT